MALGQVVYVNDQNQTVDSQGIICGWMGPHTYPFVAFPGEAFGVTGTATIVEAGVDVKSSYPISFKVKKISVVDGTESVIATGLFPANTKSITAAGAALDVTTFPVTSPADEYVVIPGGTLTPSTTHPELTVWSDAPADGQGFHAKIIISIN